MFNRKSETMPGERYEQEECIHTKCTSHYLRGETFRGAETESVGGARLAGLI